MDAAHAREIGHERELQRPDRAPVECSPGFAIAASPATIRALLLRADGGTRQRLAGALQRLHGNRAVERLLAPAPPLQVQRWRVTLPPATSDCARVVTWMNANSPYLADDGWARTLIRYRWGGDPAFSGEGSELSATVANPTVTKEPHVDMPEWAPTNPAIASAWGAMYANLRVHEARHEAIGDDWEGRLRENLSTLTVYPAARTRAAWLAAVRQEWNGWIEAQRSDQRLIDPYTAILDCRGAEPEEAAPEGEAGGGETAGGGG